MHRIHEIKIIKDIKELEVYKEDWERLYEHPNSSWTYFNTLIKNTENIISPYVIILKNGKTVSAIISGFMQKDLIECIKIVDFYLFKVEIVKLVIPYKHIIGNIEQNEAVKICAKLDNTLKTNECQKIYINNIEYNSNLHKCLLNNHHSLIIDDKFDKKGIYKVDLEKQKDKFLMKLQKYHRRSKTPDKFHFEKIEIFCYKTKEELRSFYRKAKEISEKSVKYASGYPFRETKERLQLYENLIEEDNFYAYTLSLDGEDCAFLILCIVKGICYFDQSGYDFKYKKYSPGAYLLIKVLNRIIDEEQIIGIDFDPGDHSFKKRLTESSGIVTDIKIYSKRVVPVVVYTSSKIEKKLIEIRRKFLPKFSFSEIKRKKIIKKLSD